MIGKKCTDISCFEGRDFCHSSTDAFTLRRASNAIDVMDRRSNEQSRSIEIFEIVVVSGAESGSFRMLKMSVHLFPVTVVTTLSHDQIDSVHCLQK